MPKCPTCTRLRAMIRSLRSRLELLESKPTLLAGFQGEQLISTKLDGKRQHFSSPHDIVTRRAGKWLEIKFSNLSTPVKGSKTRRWTWHGALGGTGRKVYDRLILVGVRDDDVDYGDIGKEPYIFFDVPFKKVPDVMREKGFIQISSNPWTARSSNSVILYEKYWVTMCYLEWRYGKFD